MIGGKDFGLMAIMSFVAVVGLAEDQGATPPEFIWRDVKDVRWSCHGNAKIADDELVCVADETNRNAFAIGYCDLSAYDGKPLQMQIVASTEDVTRSKKNYLGFRFMLSYLDLDMGGGRVWPNGGVLYGTQTPTEVTWRDINPKHRGKCEIQLGLHDCTGRAVYNLKTLQARATTPLVPKINEGYKVRYPDRVKNAPRGRGVMLGGMDDGAWDLLRDWRVNLVRHQISLGGTGPATNHAVYIKGYLANFEKRLDELENRLVAARKRGIRVCIDQHSSPGGRCDEGDPAEWRGDCRMFHDPAYAQLFIDCWVKLVKRVMPYRDVIYGYDLINEACHNAPALPDGDIVNLQRRCAEAIRAVDPDTTIILESMYCDPAWFARMSAIRMDNVIYQVHLYYPHDYTHQGILNPVDHVEFWPDPKKGWNRDFLRRSLKSVVDFQKQHDAKMFVGEFSVAAWAPNAEEYMRDCMTIFEELGWDWTFHAFREFQGWSVEYESTSRGLGAENFRKSSSNPRMRALKEGLKGGFAPGRPGVDYRPRAFERVVFSGNSLTQHGVSVKIGWTNDWGMAASCPEKDYVHLTVRALEAYGRKRPEFRIFPLPLEGGYADMTNVCAKAEEIATWKPDLYFIALGENAHSVTNDANEAKCRAAYLATTRILQRAGATVVLRAPFWPNDRHRRLLSSVAAETGSIYVDVGDLGWKPGMSAKGLFKHGGVAMHPGDNGMIAIADRLVSAVYERQMADESVHDK